jgi:hypothetical protein
MSFSDEIVIKAWSQSKGYCECRKISHRHYRVRCNKVLTLGNRGKYGRGCWEAHHKSISGGNTLSNCEIFCWECYSQTLNL